MVDKYSRHIPQFCRYCLRTYFMRDIAKQIKTKSIKPIKLNGKVKTLEMKLLFSEKFHNHKVKQVTF